jgi:hypothetical protein
MTLFYGLERMAYAYPGGQSTSSRCAADVLRISGLTLLLFRSLTLYVPHSRLHRRVGGCFWVPPSSTRNSGAYIYMMWYPAGSRLLHLAARRILTSWAISLYSSRTNTILAWIRSGKDGCLYSKPNGGGIMARHPLLRVLPLDEGAYCALLMPALSMTGSSLSLCRARGQRTLHVSHCQSYQSIGLL